MEKFDAKFEARRIVEAHVSGYMMGMIAEPKDEEELCEMMADECAHWLIEERLEGKLTPMQFNSVRNEITELLGKITQV